MPVQLESFEYKWEKRTGNAETADAKAASAVSYAMMVSARKHYDCKAKCSRALLTRGFVAKATRSPAAPLLPLLVKALERPRASSITALKSC